MFRTVRRATLAVLISVRESSTGVRQHHGHQQKTLSANIAPTKADIEKDSAQVESSGADVASLAHGMSTGAVAVQVNPISQAVSDATAEVVACVLKMVQRTSNV